MYQALVAAILLLLATQATVAAPACPRIISQSPYITEMLAYMEKDQCIVGVSRYSKLALPKTGGILDPDTAAIAALKPDIIITSDWASDALMKQVTPAGSHYLRLHSFNSMLQLEDNMMQLANMFHWNQAKQKIMQFAQQWRNKVKKIHGNNKKVLLLSACNGNPYSFGPNSRLYDLFTRAGFRVVETQDKIRHIRPGNELASLASLAERYQPDFIFVFQRKSAKQCQLVMTQTPIPLLLLDGELFLHPNTRILQGLDGLLQKKHNWTQ